MTSKDTSMTPRHFFMTLSEKKEPYSLYKGIVKFEQKADSTPREAKSGLEIPA